MAVSQQSEAVSAMAKGRQHGTTPEREEVLFLNVDSRDTRGPSARRGSTCLLSLLAAQCSCVCLSASQAPVSSHTMALP